MEKTQVPRAFSHANQQSTQLTEDIKVVIIVALFHITLGGAAFIAWVLWGLPWAVAVGLSLWVVAAAIVTVRPSVLNSRAARNPARPFADLSQEEIDPVR